MSNIKVYLKAMGYYLSLVSYFNDALPKTEDLKESDIFNLKIKHEFKDSSNIFDKIKIANSLINISNHFGMVSKVSFDYDNIRVKFYTRDNLKEKELKKALAN